MPVYNDIMFSRAVDSIQKQSYKDWKLWIVNDGSNCPTTLALLSGFKKEASSWYHPQIRVLDKDNGGPSSARNMALSYIQPDSFIAYCDSDDLWYSHHLEHNMRYMETGYDLVYSNPDLRDPLGKAMFPNFPLYGWWDIENLKKGNFIFTPTVIHKNGNGFFDSNLDGLEDYDYWIRAAKKGWNFIQHKQATCACTVREAGTNNMSSKGKDALPKIKAEHKDFFDEKIL